MRDWAGAKGNHLGQHRLDRYPSPGRDPGAAGAVPRHRVGGKLLGFVWFAIKAVAMVFLIMWFRWTFPRTRVDQMLSFGWKALLPLAILNVFLTGAVMFALGLV